MWEAIKDFVKEHKILTGIIIFAAVFLIFEAIDEKNEKSNPLEGYDNYRVSISSEMTSYNGVGQEFEFQYQVNGEIVQSGDIVDAKSTLQCFAKVIERDSYLYPDVATKSISIDPSKTNTTTFYITVYENGGIDNNGASATFKVTFTFTGNKKHGT